MAEEIANLDKAGAPQGTDEDGAAEEEEEEDPDRDRSHKRTRGKKPGAKDIPLVSSSCSSSSSSAIASSFSSSCAYDLRLERRELTPQELQQLRR